LSLLVLGLNHRTAALDLREMLTIEKEQLAPSLDLLSHYVEHGVLVSTCNRLEIYAFDRSEPTDHQVPDLIQRIGDYLTTSSGVTGTDLEEHLYHMEGEECARHLFRVAAGLDSMVVGERQVLGQLRSAFSTASLEGHARGPLSRLFHQALRTGRRVHRETDISRHSRSVSQAAVQLARGILGDLAPRRALVIGAGDAGRLVAKSLSDAGIRRVTVVNRTHWRAEQLAQELGGVAAPFDDLAGQLAEADVLISSSGSPGYLLEVDVVREAMRSRPSRPLLIVDIAVPRDVDPRVAELEGVQLYDIDSLQLVAETDAAALRQAIDSAQLIVDEETSRFADWWERLDAVPLVASIRRNAEEIRRQELAKTWRKLVDNWPLDNSEAGRDQLAQQLDAMTSAIIKKLLHHPTLYLKELKDPVQQELVHHIFNLDGLSQGNSEGNSTSSSNRRPPSRNRGRDLDDQ
jgi:glutamyl-tRNA reductase